MAKVKRGRRAKVPWLTYSRCFLITLGGLFVGLVVIIFLTDTTEMAIPWYAWVLAGALFLFGLTLISMGIFGSKRVADRWVDSMPSDEGVLVVLLVSAPLYYLLAAISKK